MNEKMQVSDQVFPHRPPHTPKNRESSRLNAISSKLSRCETLGAIEPGRFLHEDERLAVSSRNRGKQAVSLVKGSSFSGSTTNRKRSVEFKSGKPQRCFASSLCLVFLDLVTIAADKPQVRFPVLFHRAPIGRLDFSDDVHIECGSHGKRLPEPGLGKSRLDCHRFNRLGIDANLTSPVQVHVTKRCNQAYTRDLAAAADFVQKAT